MFLVSSNTAGSSSTTRSEEHTSELQSQSNLVCRLLLEKKKHTHHININFFYFFFFFFNDTATTEIYTLSLHDALPIYYVHHDHFDLFFVLRIKCDGVRAMNGGHDFVTVMDENVFGQFQHGRLIVHDQIGRAHV